MRPSKKKWDNRIRVYWYWAVVCKGAKTPRIFVNKYGFPEIYIKRKDAIQSIHDRFAADFEKYEVQKVKIKISYTQA